jgi:hypothetical protein
MDDLSVQRFLGEPDLRSRDLRDSTVIRLRPVDLDG